VTPDPIADPDFVAALARCTDDADLIAWHGGGGPQATCGLAWDLETADVTSWNALRTQLDAWTDATTRKTHHPPAGDPTAVDHGWDRFPGGCWIQLDYEFPAHPGRAWRPRSWWSWQDGSRISFQKNTVDSRALSTIIRDFLARPEQPCPRPRATALHPAWDRAGHGRRVDDIRARIAAGEIYQANLTLPFTAPLAACPPGTDIGLFLALIAQSPGGFAVLMRHAGRTVISHSPECLLRAHASGGATGAGLDLASLPIKGTRRRLPGREREVRAELLASEKDRAELAMIVDLVRNDLGRVAAPGSVRVAAAATVLDLPHLHHLVARVVARARPECDAIDALAALFPAGSIVGAPKLRAQQVLRALESGPRGPYCGTFGWLAPEPQWTPTWTSSTPPSHRITEANLAVAIRTLVLEGGTATLHAGGGIVADSHPEREWEEACAKAAGMAAAVGITLRGDL